MNPPPKLTQRLLPRGLFLCYNKEVNLKRSQVLKSTQFTYIFLGVIAILGWNIWAIQKDAKLLEAYDYQKGKIEFCSSQAGWHPDCNDDKIYKRYYEKSVKEGASK